jgi:hypothetical protein
MEGKLMKTESEKKGSKTWFVADGWLPSKNPQESAGLEGHEAIIILNCNKEQARVNMDVFYEDKDPVENIELLIPAQRVRCFRMDQPEEIGGLKIGRLEQYALRFRSDLEVIVQYGRMDVTQPNLAYIGCMGHAG